MCATSRLENSASTWPTRFADWTRGRASTVLIAFFLATSWCFWVARTRETVPAHSSETKGDAEFYRDVVRRVHAGESYYEAVDNGLRARGYTPHSVFNWRTPFVTSIFSQVPNPQIAQGFLIAAMIATMLVAYGVVGATGGKQRAAVAAVLLLGPFLWAFFPDVAFFTELWAGMLIVVSICAAALERRQVSVVAGIAALFVRELTLPYCLIALGLALWERRWRESASWIIGLTLYALFMAWHVAQVRPHLSPTNVMHLQGWLQWNGTAYILLTCQINFFLLQAPSWLAAVYLPLALLGLLGWRSRTGLLMLLTASAYVAAFAVVGIKPHNAYWGLMYAPLLPFGLAWAPASLRDLAHAAFGSAMTLHPRPALASVNVRT